MSEPRDEMSGIECLRCAGVSLRVLPESLPEMTFFECPVCSRQYARRADGNLTYRWRHPVSLALYGVIFDAHPLSKAKDVAHSLLRAQTPVALKTLLDEIDAEIARPTQRVREILDSVASEAECRLFLAAVARELRSSIDVGPSAK